MNVQMVAIDLSGHVHLDLVAVGDQSDILALDSSAWFGPLRKTLNAYGLSVS